LCHKGIINLYATKGTKFIDENDFKPIETASNALAWTYYIARVALDD
jgi:hypothetical protein